VTIVAVCAASGSAAATTTSVALASMLPAGYPALLAECDPSGGDVASWAQQSSSPGWSSAVSAGDRSWTAIADNSQRLPSGLAVLATPARAAQAHTAVGEAAREFAGLLAAAPDVVTVADCGRVGLDAPVFAMPAQLTLLLVRQSLVSAPATVARVDRAIEALGVLRATCRQVGVVLIGGAPYRSAEIAGALGAELFGVLPEDVAGAALVAGGWTVGKRASRSPLAKAAATLGERVVEAIYGRDHRSAQLWTAGAVS
jgi:hypothetical protein